LSVFQTICTARSKTEYGLFQSLDWVERLSDLVEDAQGLLIELFQSLDWVERLSDRSSG